MTTILLVLNVVVFAFQQIDLVYLRFPLFKYFALSKDGLAQGYVWQVVTFQFLHNGALHLILNLFALFIFGRAVEERLGRTNLLKLYLLSGVCGGLLQASLGWLAPRFYGMSVVGASAGVFGLVAAFAALDPEQTLLIWFVLPIRAKYFLLAAGAIALFNILVPSGSHIAHAAHLGGILGGLGFVRWMTNSGPSISRWKPFRSAPSARPLFTTRSLKAARWRRSHDPEEKELPPAEFISKEVDPILDKISLHGIQSLTSRERQILEAARAKMEKR